MVKQRTLKDSIQAKGTDFNTGEEICLTIRPAPAGTGIVFRRIDLDPVVEIKAPSKKIEYSASSITIGSNGISVSRIENLMSAFASSSIDNAWIDVAAEEIPIMDGTAAPFDFLIQSAGFEEQDG